jgi:Phage portal protein, lambda family
MRDKRTWIQKALVRTLVFAAALPLIGPAAIRGMNRVAQVMARFDAAFQGWGERSWIFQSLQDAWIEIDAMTRQECQRIHIALVENSSLVQKIRNLKIQFSVGPSGLKVIPESSDEGFNDARSESWENWWARPQLGCNISGAQLTRVWAGMLFDMGAIFVNLIEPAASSGRNKTVPKLQTIEAHRVKSPTGKVTDDVRGGTGFPIVDGVVVNPQTGQPIAYYVRKTDYATGTNYGQQTTTEDFDRIPAFDPENPRKGGMIHKFKVRRPGQIRELPEGTSVYNLARDNMDLHKLEMQCAKIASEIALVETNPSGELDALYNRKSKLQINTQNIAGGSAIKNAWADYNVSIGGKKIAIKNGSKIEDFMVKRPTVATQDYWDLQVTFICIGYNVPKMLVMPYSLQGTVTRADLDICTAAFREEFELIRELCETIYEWQGNWDLGSNLKFTPQNRKEAIDCYGFSTKGRELKARGYASMWVMDAKVPTDAHVCLIRPPRAPNVDIGYTAKALEIELRLGVKNPQEVFADKGQDWRTQTRQMAEYITYVQALEKEFGLQPGQITSLTTPQPIQDPTSRPDQPEGDPKEGSPEARLA